MPLNYEIHGCFVEVADGGRTATARRLEIKSPVRNASGDVTGEQVIRSAAAAKFETMVEKRDGVDTFICAQEQAHLWARALPDVIEPTEDDRDGE